MLFPRRSHQVGDTILEELAVCKEQGDKELLNLALGLASLVFTNDEDVEWLERKLCKLFKISVPKIRA